MIGCILIGGLILSSCNKDIELDLREPDALIVIDGWIEPGKQAKVLLTTNTPYFTSIDSASIRDLVLSRAKVSISDGENSEVLILRRDERYFPPFYYAGNTIFGAPGKVYTIKAEYGGKIASANSSIPTTVEIDTVLYEPIVDADSVGRVRIVFSDPPGEKNYYRIYTWRLGKDDRYVSAFLMAIDDQYFDGEQVGFSISLPPKSLLSTDDSEFFRAEDTVLVKLSTMDKASFDFWDSYQEEVINATNPFASSMQNLASNVEGDGLGIWCGYGVDVDTIWPSVGSVSDLK